MWVDGKQKDPLRNGAGLILYPDLCRWRALVCAEQERNTLIIPEILRTERLAGDGLIKGVRLLSEDRVDHVGQFAEDSFVWVIIISMGAKRGRELSGKLCRMDYSSQ